MKAIALYSVLSLFFILPGFSQPNTLPDHSLKSGAGIAFLGSQGLPGFMFSAGYDNDALPFLRLSPGISFITAAETSPESAGFQHTSAAALSMKVGLSPFYNHWSALYINGGVTARYAANSIIQSTARLPGNSTGSIPQAVIHQGLSVGYIIGADYELYLHEKYILTPNVSVQGFSDGSSLAFFGLSGGIWL